MSGLGEKRVEHSLRNLTYESYKYKSALRTSPWNCFRYPSTRLGRLARCAKLRDALKYCNIVYDYQIPEFFFDRNSDNFLAILGCLKLNYLIKVMICFKKLLFSRYISNGYLSLDFCVVCSSHPEEHGVLGHRWASHGALLCSEILSRDRHLRQRKTGKF